MCLALSIDYLNHTKLTFFVSFYYPDPSVLKRILCGGNMILVGDIGGTKTIMQAVDEAQGTQNPVHEEIYPSQNHGGLDEIIDLFLKKHGFAPTIGSFGVAGPVVDGKAQLANLPWIIDESELKVRWGFRSVILLNDLEAIAKAVPLLKENDLHPINQGVPNPHGNIAVIAPGTGLGEAFLTREPDGWRTHASEGGHADFAPTDDLQAGILQFLINRFGHVSYERVCSGSGMPNIFDYLESKEPYEVPAVLRSKLEEQDDKTPVIMENARGDSPFPICKKTVEIFASILAAESGNMALRLVAKGGVYLAGGIPSRLLDVIGRRHFMDIFLNKGRMASLLSDIPVHVVTNQKCVAIGAAAAALSIAR